tara:strand:- start:1596 stop:1850 length:255 start_codon:yes stop_codon:yes gene_type:complete
MNLIVIHEKDHEDNEESVIGVADSVKSAESIIEKYYGKDNYTEVSFNDIRDSNLEYSKVIELKWHKSEPTKVTLTLEWFSLNKA